MSRRITAAIVGIVIGTMLLAGIGTIVASRVAGKAREISALEDRANTIADLVPNLDRNLRPDNPTLVEAQEKLVKVLGLSGVTQLRISAKGALVGTRPSWIPATRSS
mgnify:FL=1